MNALVKQIDELTAAYPGDKGNSLSINWPVVSAGLPQAFIPMTSL